MTDVRGYCPMGCGETLFLGSGGYVTCSLIGCPRPDAVSTLLGDRETEHVVWIEGLFTVRHPLRERLDDAQLSCDLDRHLAGLDGPPCAPGQYRVVCDGERWTWRRINGKTTRASHVQAGGFVRPLRTSYRHLPCGAVTTMAAAIAETFARHPTFYGDTYCAQCNLHGPVVEFEWLDGSKVGT